MGDRWKQIWWGCGVLGAPTQRDPSSQISGGRISSGISHSAVAPQERVKYNPPPFC